MKVNLRYIEQAYGPVYVASSPGYANVAIAFRYGLEPAIVGYGGFYSIPSGLTHSSFLVLNLPYGTPKERRAYVRAYYRAHAVRSADVIEGMPS